MNLTDLAMVRNTHSVVYCLKVSKKVTELVRKTDLR